MEKKKISKSDTGNTWIDDTGQKVHNVHDEKDCQGTNCCIHNPSDHHMKDWPRHWRYDRCIMERICPHGVGHPDPDDVAYLTRIGAPDNGSMHGCDGCCKPPED